MKTDIVIKRATYVEAKELKLWDVFVGDRRIDNWRGELLVALTDNQVVGYINYSSNLFYNRPFISLLCVKESHRRRGIAQSLMRSVLEIYQGLDLWTSTEEWNVAAIGLFAKLGFQKMGAIRGLDGEDSNEFYFIYKAQESFT